MNPFTNIERVECSQEEYYAIDAYSGSDIRKLYADRNNPYGVKKQRSTPVVETDAMLLGSLLDCMITEPEMVRERYLEMPEFSFLPTTPKQKAFVAAVMGGDDLIKAHADNYANSSERSAQDLYDSLEPYMAFLKLTAGEKKGVASPLWHRARECYKSLMANKRFKELCGDSYSMQSVYVAEAFGVRWKGMLDLDGSTWACDVKTTEDWYGIRGNFFRRGYDLQGRIYTWLSGKDIYYNAYAESVDPHRTKVVNTTQHVNDCSERCIDLMIRIAHADKSGDWLHTMEYEENGEEEL